jgi:hypothetical protein
MEFIKRNHDGSWQTKGGHVSFEQLCSWGVYLARCDIARKMLDSKTKSRTSLSTWFKYWFPYYANLYIVIEGWREIKFHNQRIDALLESHKETIGKLRRLRNSVFHYRKSMMDARFKEFLESENAIEWAYLLNDNFNQFFYEISYKDIPGPVKPKRHIKSLIKQLLGWYPETIDDIIEKHKQIFIRFKKRARSNDDLSDKAKNVALSAAKTIRCARQAKLRLSRCVDNLNNKAH